MFKKITTILKKFFLATALLQMILIFSSCRFAHEKHITGRYSIVGIDEKELSISYELSSGDYVGKIPGIPIEYGYNDTFLIAKSQEYNKKNTAYYIIDMRNDSDLAIEETFRIGPISENIFDSVWKQKLKIIMHKI